LIGSFVSFTRQIILTLAGFAAFNQTIRAMASFFRGAIGIVEEFRLSVVQTAAVLTSLSPAKTFETFNQALAYSQAAMERLEILAARFVATGQDLQRVFFTFATQGVIPVTARDFEALGRITDAILAITAGQNKELQLRQEVRGLLSGQIRDTSILAQLIRGQVGDLKSWVEEHRRAGDLLPAIAEKLAGFKLAQKSILELASTWLNTLKTIYALVIRRAFAGVYDDIVRSLREMSNRFIDAQGRLTQLSQEVIDRLKPAFEALGPAIRTWLQVLADPKTLRLFTQFVSDIVSLFSVTASVLARATAWLGQFTEWVNRANDAITRYLASTRIGRLLGIRPPEETRPRPPVTRPELTSLVQGIPTPPPIEPPKPSPEPERVREQIRRAVESVRRWREEQELLAETFPRQLAIIREAIARLQHLASTTRLNSKEKELLREEIERLEFAYKRLVVEHERAAKALELEAIVEQNLLERRQAEAKADEENRRKLREWEEALESRRQAMEHVLEVARDLRDIDELLAETDEERIEATVRYRAALQSVLDQWLKRAETLPLVEQEREAIERLRREIEKLGIQIERDRRVLEQRRRQEVFQREVESLERQRELALALAETDEQRLGALIQYRDALEQLLTKWEAIPKLTDEERATIERLRFELARLGIDIEKLRRSIAEGIKTRDFLGGLELAVQTLLQQVTNWRDVWLGFFQETREAFREFFRDVVSGAKSFGDALLNLFRSIVNKIIDILADLFANWLLRWVLGFFLPPVTRGSLITFGQGGIAPHGLALAQAGTVVRRPTLAFLAERGQPEAVVPLTSGLRIPVQWVGPSEPTPVNLQVVVVDDRQKVPTAKPGWEQIVVDLVTSDIMRRGTLFRAVKGVVR